MSCYWRNVEFNYDIFVIFFLGDGEMVVLKIGKYKDVSNNDEDVILNLGGKEFIEMNMVNKYYDLIVGFE